MIYLSNAAIRYAFEVAQEIEQYRVLIVLNSEDEKNNVINILNDCIVSANEDDDKPITTQTSITRRRKTLYFANGSIIDVLSPVHENTMRGFKAHLVIASRYFQDNFVYTSIRMTEILEDFKQREIKEEMERDINANSD